MKRSWHRLLYCIAAASVSVLPACSSDGHLNLFGYSTAPNYDLGIRTVHVPICKNKSMRRGLEFDLTRAIIREIQYKTPYRVVDSPVGADTELLCTIIARPKRMVNINQLGETRDAEITLTVEVLWRDLRPGHTGDILSNPGGRIAGQAPPGSNPLQPPTGKSGGVILSPTASYQPELGASTTTAEQSLEDKLAVQIVSMMEVWGH